ncbi:MarC family protein [Puia sp.]|jgi:multiple antibiotic resistance protein|uniref:MarC family protein n=1 Tax=Puia sp. TaxID=2045100 RepID=UPI002F421DEE
MHFDLPFLHTIFIGFLSLFPAVNPVGSAFIIDPLLGDLSYPDRKRAAKKVALYCFVICLVSALIGSWIMRLFGISIPIVQLAGGVLICRMGWQLLNTDQVKGEKETAQPERRSGDIDNLLFYPISFPMSTGAGTISVILTLAAHEEETDLLGHFINLGALFIAILLICLLIYICYANTARLIRRLGPRGEQIVNRLSAFLVFCIGMQIAYAGIRALFKF